MLSEKDVMKLLKTALCSYIYLYEERDRKPNSSYSFLSKGVDCAEQRVKILMNVLELNVGIFNTYIANEILSKLEKGELQKRIK